MSKFHLKKKKKMEHCCQKFILLILSLISFGLVCAAAGVGIWADKKYDLDTLFAPDKEVSTFTILLIVILCVSALFLIYSIYASCSNSGCAGFILGVLFLIIAAALVAVAVVCIKFKGDIYDTIGKVWDDPNNSNETKNIIKELSEELLGNCTTWNTGDNPCEQALKDAVNPYLIWVIVGICFAALLFIIGTVLAFMKICHKSSDGYEKKNTSAAVEQPLSYGW